MTEIKGLKVLATLSLGIVMASCGSAKKATTTTTAQRSPSKSHSSATSSTTSTTATTDSSTTSTTTSSTTTTAITYKAGAVCAPDQLAVSEGPGGVGLGSETLSFTFKNTSSVECYLEGYPGLQMLNAQGSTISTQVHWGSSVSVPPEPVTKVAVSPGGSAYFLIGFALGTGYGSEQCPTANFLDITPPNDQGYLKVPATITPFGGTVQNLQCGQITASPVLSSLPQGI